MAGYCVLESAAFETAMFDRSKLTSVTRQSFLPLSLSLFLEKLRCYTRCVRDADRRRGSPFTIVTAVGAVNSKIGNQGLSFNLYVCVRERECRGNRPDKIGVLRFSPKTNFYVKRKCRRNSIIFSDFITL